jgi:hypothetical protein
MANKLTDITEKTGAFADDDLLHIVDVSDDTDDPAGSSFKVELLNLFASFTWIKIGSSIVLKLNPSPNNAVIQDGDLVIYMTDTRLVIGKALASLTVLGDYDDPAKFAKFIDGSPLL